MKSNVYLSVYALCLYISFDYDDTLHGHLSKAQEGFYQTIKVSDFRSSPHWTLKLLMLTYEVITSFKFPWQQYV